MEQAKAEIITLALRRANQDGRANIFRLYTGGRDTSSKYIRSQKCGGSCKIARLSREVGCGDFVKIEIMRDTKYLLPDNYETIKATEILAKRGFVVMPYMYPDLNVARDLQNAGAASIMPLAAPIGIQ